LLYFFKKKKHSYKFSKKFSRLYIKDSSSQSYRVCIEVYYLDERGVGLSSSNGREGGGGADGNGETHHGEVLLPVNTL